MRKVEMRCTHRGIHTYLSIHTYKRTPFFFSLSHSPTRLVMGLLYIILYYVSYVMRKVDVHTQRRIHTYIFIHTHIYKHTPFFSLSLSLFLSHSSPPPTNPFWCQRQDGETAKRPSPQAEHTVDWWRQLTGAACQPIEARWEGEKNQLSDVRDEDERVLGLIVCVGFFIFLTSIERSYSFTFFSHYLAIDGYIQVNLVVRCIEMKISIVSNCICDGFFFFTFLPRLLSFEREYALFLQFIMQLMEVFW